MENKERDLFLAHNLPSINIDQNINAFLENDKYRKQTKATTRWYHEILSFSPYDSKHLSNSALEAIAQQYIEMRNPRSLCLAVSHTGEDHTHIHFCFSGTEYRSRKTLRMDDKTFKNLRLGMERYQLEQFPNLINSIVYLNHEQVKRYSKGWDKSASLQREYQAKKRLGKKPTEKEQLQVALREAINSSQSKVQFYNKLRDKGLNLYERDGKVTGVKGKRKYRFKTLGITPKVLQSLDKLSQRQRDLHKLSQTTKENEYER